MGSTTLGENFDREWRDDSHAPEVWDALKLIECDPIAGIEALTQLVDAGSQLAKIFLGEVRLKGLHGFPKDPEAGERLLRDAADHGSIEAAYGLAWHLRKTGQTAAALAEYEKLSDIRYSPALYALGAHFCRGTATERDLAKALNYFHRGEALGHFYAANRAYRILMRGEMGMRERFRGLAKMCAILPPFFKTA